MSQEMSHGDGPPGIILELRAEATSAYEWAMAATRDKPGAVSSWDSLGRLLSDAANVIERMWAANAKLARVETVVGEETAAIADLMRGPSGPGSDTQRVNIMHHLRTLRALFLSQESGVS